MKTIITVVILIIVSVGIQMMDSLPWWSYLVAVFLIGFGLPLQKWKVWSFFWGFIAGLVVWIGSTIYFEMAFKGEIVRSLGKLIELNDNIIYLIIGSIGGVLTGLSFYSGFLLRKGKETLSLELPDKGASFS
jgi:hypothetical protein